MKSLFNKLPLVCFLVITAIATSSCGTVKKAGSGTVAVVKKSSSAVKKSSAVVADGVASLMPGPKIAIVQPRVEDFKEVQNGSELAQTRRRGFFGGGMSNFSIFSEKLYFEQPGFSEDAGSDLLLPPVPEP